MNSVTAVLQFDSSLGWHAISGSLPSAETLASLREAAQARPAARKLGEGMVIVVPVAKDRWHFWLLDSVPPVKELADLLSRFQQISAGFAGQVPAAANSPEAPAGQAARPSVLGAISGQSARSGRLRADAVAKLGLQELVESGLAERAALFTVRGGKPRKFWLSDQRLANNRDEMRLLARTRLDTAPSQARILASSTEDGELEAALLARQAGHDNLALLLPPAAGGHGLIAFGTPEGSLEALAELPRLMSVVAPPKLKASGLRRWVRRVALVGGLALLGYWLAQPAPIRLAATGSTIAAEATVVALPEDAFLRQIKVRVGDRIEAGAAIADFASPKLKESEAQEQLNVSVEQMNAQAALAENNYGAYQLATQRAEIAQTRLNQLREREAGLAVAAPATGRVIEALPDSVTGSFLTTGTPVVTIQTGAGFRMVLNLSRVDARFVVPGVTGSVYFRGLGGRSYAIRVLTPAAIVVDQRTGAESVQALAEVIAEDQRQLIVGLAGYARLDGPTAPRIVGVTRDVTEFIKVRLWTYLGLHY